MADLSPIQQHFLNKASESNFALWNALLTVNGIILTAYSILPIVSPTVTREVSLFLVACCLISLLLVVWNFLSTNQHYRDIGRMLSGIGPELTDEQRRLDIEAENRQRSHVLLRERIALFLLVGETFLIILLLYLAPR
jgi:uncharacterized membrane protein YhdT